VTIDISSVSGIARESRSLARTLLLQLNEETSARAECLINLGIRSESYEKRQAGFGEFSVAAHSNQRAGAMARAIAQSTTIPTSSRRQEIAAAVRPHNKNYSSSDRNHSIAMEFFNV